MQLRKCKIKGKKGQMLTFFGIGAAILAALLIFGFMAGMISIPKLTQGKLQIQSTEDEGITFTTKCPDDGKTTVYMKLQDDYAATETYITGTVDGDNLQVMDLTKGLIVGSTNSSASGWVSQDVDCGDKIKIYAIADPGNAGSAESSEFVATGDTMYKVLHTGSLSKMTIKVKDIVGDDWETMLADGLTAGTNVTTGVDLNNSILFDDAISTAIAVGTDGYVNFEFHIQSATARKYGNDVGERNGIDENTGTRLGMKNYLCVDLGGATNGQEWDTDSLKVNLAGSGTTLPNVYSSLDQDSKEYVYLQKVEACYDIGDIGDVFKQINFYVKAKSGQDPDATDDDIVIYFFGEGAYKSSDASNTIKKGVFSDASTQQGVLFDLTGEVPYFTINIS